jgi:hypothetical protein
VVHLYRRQDLQPDRAVVRSTLERKCEFKGIAVPTYAALTDRPERAAIEVEWEQMLAHQLPTCPPFAEFWLELPEVFEWLNEAIAAPTYAVPGKHSGAMRWIHLAPAADGSGLGRRGGIAGDDPLCRGQPPLRATGLHQGQRRAHVADDRTLLGSPDQRRPPAAVRREGRHRRIPQLPAGPRQRRRRSRGKPSGPVTSSS